MNSSRHLKVPTFGSALSTALLVAGFSILASASPRVLAQTSVDNMPNLDRAFSYSDAPGSDSYKRVEFYMKGDPSLETFKKYLRRDNINFVTGYTTGNKPPFTSLVESVATPGAREIIQKQWGIQGKPPTNRSINQQFNQRLISGKPQMIDAYGLGGGKTFVGPVYKRAIFLQRDGEASAATVDAELSGFAQSVAKKVDGLSDRVMLYSMKGLPRNWPTASFPADKIVNRKFDAVVMIWPQKDKMLPLEFFGVPSNYKILYGVNLAGYYYAAPAPAK